MAGVFYGWGPRPTDRGWRRLATAGDGWRRMMLDGRGTSGADRCPEVPGSRTRGSTGRGSVPLRPASPSAFPLSPVVLPGGVRRSWDGVGLDVGGGVALVAPAFGERADVLGVVPDRVQEVGLRLLGLGVVAGDGKHGTLRVTGRARQGGAVGDVEVIERLTTRDSGRWSCSRTQQRHQRLSDRRRLVVELCDVPVPVRVVVVDVDDRLSAERLDRHRARGLERDRHPDDVAGGGGPGRTRP